MQAKKAALQRKLKFAVTIAEQQQRLEQLKLEQELEAINAQEAVYQKAIDEEVNVATDPPDPCLPNQPHSSNLDTHTKENTNGNAVVPSSHLNSDTMPPPSQPHVSERTKQSVSNSSPQIQLLVEKLPSWFKTKWSDKIIKLQREQGKDSFPSFNDFAETVKYHAERMNIPQILSSASLREPTKTPTRPGNRNSSIVNLTSKFDENDEEQAQENENKRSTYCFYHKRTTHATNECEQLQRLSFNERKDFLLKNRLCFNCVNSNQHIARNCNEGKQTCKICQQEHATTLHNPTEHVPPSATERTTSAYANSSSPNQSSRSCARIVLVQIFHQDNPLTRVPTYAVLDDQSTDVFVTDSLLSQLRAKGRDVNLEVNTILGTNSIRTKKVNGLRIQDVEGRHQPIKISHAYSRESIPASQSDIATPEVASKWKHLQEISRHLQES